METRTTSAATTPILWMSVERSTVRLRRSVQSRARETARFAYGMLEDKPATSETAATEFTRASLDETIVGTVPATAPIPTPSPAAAQIATQND